MSIKLNFNLYSMIAQQNLSRNVNSLNKVMEQLSSGERLNSPKDDPAAFKVSENLQREINGDERIISNIECSVDFLSIAESGLDSINAHLERIRTLCLQGSNTYYRSSQVSAIMTEIKGRLEEIDRVASSVTAGGLSLLDGTCSDLKLQIGSKSDPFENTLEVGAAFSDVHTSTLGLDTSLFDTDTPMSVDDFVAFLDSVDSAMTIVNESVSQIGYFTNTLDTKREFLSELLEVNSTYRSSIIDTDVAKASSEMVKQQILQNINVSVIQQANQIPTIAMQLLG